MSDLTYNETMSLTKLIPFEVREPFDGKNPELIHYYEMINGNQHSQKFEPFDPRWCGVYVEWFTNQGVNVRITPFASGGCECVTFRDVFQEGDTPTEAVARTVLAVMRERGMVT